MDRMAEGSQGTLLSHRGHHISTQHCTDPHSQALSASL